MDIIVIIIMSIVVILILLKQTSQKEHYYDLTPYNLHWDIFKCLDADCVIKKSYICYKWCDNWDEPGGSENCRTRCADYADEMFDSLKFQDYTFSYLLPRFKKVSILTDRDDIVEWTTKG